MFYDTIKFSIDRPLARMKVYLFTESKDLKTFQKNENDMIRQKLYRFWLPTKIFLMFYIW